MNEPLVSVVIPAYNAAHTLGRTLESVAAQTYRPLEVIVVDDGSEDDTGRVVEEAAAGAAPEGVTIRYVRQANGGPAKARNSGTAAAEGDFVAYVDADDIWTPEKTERQVEVFREFPEVGLVFTDAEVSRTRDGRSWEFRVFEKLDVGPAYFGHPSLVHEPLGKLLEKNFVPTSSVMIRRECLKAHGLRFNVETKGVEDWELWLDLAIHCPFGYVSDVCVYKYEDGENLSARAHHMLVTRLKVLDSFVAKYGDLSGRVEGYRRLVKENYKWAGYNLMRMGDPRRSRRYLLASMRYAFDLQAAAYYLSTFWRGRRVPG